MSRQEKVIALMQEGQQKLTRAFEETDNKAKFKEHTWQHKEGGGGRARVLEKGKVFEKAGVNVSAVHGKRVPASLAQKHQGIEGKPFLQQVYLWFYTHKTLMCLLFMPITAILK